MKATTNTNIQKLNTFTIEVPTGACTTFLRNLARNMGWKTKVCRTKTDNTEMDREEFIAKVEKAKQQAREGHVSPIFHSANDAIAYLDTL